MSLGCLQFGWEGEVPFDQFSLLRREVRGRTEGAVSGGVPVPQDRQCRGLIYGGAALHHLTAFYSYLVQVLSCRMVNLSGIVVLLGVFEKVIK